MFDASLLVANNVVERSNARFQAESRLRSFFGIHGMVTQDRQCRMPSCEILKPTGPIIVAFRHPNTLSPKCSV